MSNSENSNQNVANSMQQLKQRYLIQLSQRIEHLEKILVSINDNQLNEAMSVELKSQAHKLNGTGATYGFPAISSAGKDLEECMDVNKKNTRELIPKINGLIAQCEIAINSSNIITIEDSEKTELQNLVLSQEFPLLLIIDDDEDVRIMLAELFKDHAKTIHATNAQQGLLSIRQYKPDLILLDNNMPGELSGLMLLENIQKIEEIKKIPIIMITASDDAQEVMRGLMAGAVDYITKPFDPAILTSKISQRLQRLKNTILVADDDPNIRDLLTHKFENIGLKIITANDGNEAWNILQTQSIQVAILDRMMPGIDGLTLLRMIRNTKNLSKIAVIFLTAKHADTDVLEGLNTGAVDYITKPFNPNELLARCTRLLENKNT
ncbi:MAG: response regulator [Pseudomonadota bacterium]